MQSAQLANGAKLKPFEVHSVFPTAIGKFELGGGFTKNELREIKSAYSDSQTNFGNYLSKDTFVLERNELKRIKKFALESVNRFAVECLDVKNIKFRITQSWANMTEAGHFHHEHSHPNSIMSGVIYVDVSEGDCIRFRKDKVSEFRLHYNSFNQFTSPTFVVDAKIGEMLLFPSMMYHDVPHVVSQNRVSIAFNTFVDGDLGNIEDLTNVKFN